MSTSRYRQVIQQVKNRSDVKKKRTMQERKSDEIVITLTHPTLPLNYSLHGHSLLLHPQRRIFPARLHGTEFFHQRQHVRVMKPHLLR